ncbi:MAG: 2'-5' RNA ligase family protein [Nanoarchaeota archaeon]
MIKDEICIVCLIKGYAGKYHNSLVKEISSNFGTNDLSQRIPPHVTIKSPFFTKNINEIEEVIYDFSKKLKKSSFNLEGFDHFRKNVIFINVIANDYIINIARNLMELLRKIKGITFSEYEDKQIHYHATIAYCESEKIFNAIWSYLSNKRPEYNVYFNNITILKKVKDKWKIHKEFDIG